MQTTTTTDLLHDYKKAEHGCLTSHTRDVGFTRAGNEFAVEIHHDQSSVLFLKHNTHGSLPSPANKKTYIEKH